MKSGNYLILAACLSLATASCSLARPKYGCPSSGKNVGAERLLSDPNASRKAKKFKA
jgi:hypothetical protein